MKSTSFQTRLFACFAAVLVFAIGAAVHSIYSVVSLRDQLRNEIQVSSERLDQSRLIMIGLANMRTAMRGVSLFSQDGNSAGVGKARTQFDAAAQQMRDATSAL